MSKSDFKCTNEQEALEMIELNIDSCELLTRAFDLIVDICEYAHSEEEILDEEEHSPQFIH